MNTNERFVITINYDLVINSAGKTEGEIADLILKYIG